MDIGFVAGVALVSALILSAMFATRAMAAVLLAAAMVLSVAGAGGTPLATWDVALWRPVGMVLGLGMLIAALPSTGLATWLSIRALRLSGGQPFRLLLLLTATIVALSLLTNALLAMLVVGSLTLVASKRLGLDVGPFLIVEAVCANLAGTLTLTSSFPNAILGTAGGLDYLDIALGSGPFVAIGILLTVAVARLGFYKVFAPLSDFAAKAAEQRVARFDPLVSMGGAGPLQPVWYVMLGTLALLLLHGFVPVLREVDPVLLVLIGAALALLFHSREPTEVLPRVDWGLVLYMGTMAILLGVCRVSGLMDQAIIAIYNHRAIDVSAMPLVGMLVTAMGGAALGNVQVSVVTAALFENAPPFPGVHVAETTWWMLILGSSLGGMLPPVGSGVTLTVWMMFERQGVPTNRLKFLGEMGIFALLLAVLAGVHLLALDMLGRPYRVYGGAAAWLLLFGLVGLLFTRDRAATGH